MSALVRFYNKFTRELAITTALSSSGFVMGYILIDSHKCEKKQLVEKIATLDNENKLLKSNNIKLQKIVMDLAYHNKK
jgi:hypothetical protein